MLSIARLIHRSFPEVTITLVSTARNIAALRGYPDASAASISLHALPFVPADHGLPDDCESSSTLPVAQFITLFEAFESLEPAFDALVSSLRRDAGGLCIVADPTVAWTVDVARRHGCAHALYLSCSALGSAILHALWRHMPSLPFGPDGLLRLRVPEHQEEVALHRSQLSTIFLEADGVERWTAFQHRRIQCGYRTDAVIVNTVEELEPKGLAMVRHTLGDDVAVYAVGPFVRGAGAEDSEKHERDAAVLGWLDTQRPASVLYISFGSQNSIRPEQMTELASALELTGRPFVWAIRAPVGFKDDGDGGHMSWLPEGFEERARAQNRGRLVRGWAPQVKILAHVSTGGFLSHCGWNSVLESLTQGVPIVGWPVSAEQFYNAKMLQEWGVCVEAARGNMESSAVCRSKLAEVMEAVMGDADTARVMRHRVLDAQEMLRKAWAEDGGSSRTALHGFFRRMQLVIS